MNGYNLYPAPSSPSALLVPWRAGTNRTMPRIDKRQEVVERAARLVEARKRAGFSGPKPVSDALGVNYNSYKAYEQGRNGFSVPDAKQFAKAFNVSLQWLQFGIGSPDDKFVDETPIEIPVLSMVSAGDLMQDHIQDDHRRTVKVVGLQQGDWIALEVIGSSMDRISPPGSIILVNRREKRLVPNACYVIADEDGAATYKRFRPEPMRFEPVSTEVGHETIFPENEPVIIGRVRRSVLEM
jgi:SOS-response transcriptional repressor LexA